MSTNLGESQVIPAIARQFVLAGKSIFTLRLQTGERYTYKVSQVEDKLTGEKLPKWFVSVLTGPDNWANYTYAGMLENGHFRTTGRSRISSNAPSMIVFQGWIELCLAGLETPGIEIWHTGRCGRCGRLLTVPESVAIGIGPDCLASL